MTSTPPPPRRLRTPPTPRHGPKYDSHEPYSPRRSSRISAKQDEKPSLSDMNSLSTYQSNSASSSTPRPSRKRIHPRTSSQTFSPPSSPISPDLRDTKSRNDLHAKGSRSSNGRTAAGRSSTEPESDVDASRHLNPRGIKRRSADMLPTPRKTPNKKGSHATAHLGSTARALFVARPANVEDVMPSPRKSKMSRKVGLFSLDGLDDEENGSGIEIYTDSKERIPDVDVTDDNPFLIKSKLRKLHAQSSPSASRKTRKTNNGMTTEIDEAVKNNEGMVYVFRGKRFYRKFDDANDQDEPDDIDELGNDELLRQVGPAARRPFTRSTIIPRLLFPPKEPTPERLLDEEAMTDIETTDRPFATDDDDIVTPVKPQFKPVTPPTTGNHTRRKGQKITPDSSPIGSGLPDSDRSPLSRSSRSTLLDTWPRSKPGVQSVPTKRGGDPIDRVNGASGKRTKGSS